MKSIHALHSLYVRERNAHNVRAGKGSSSGSQRSTAALPDPALPTGKWVLCRAQLLTAARPHPILTDFRYPFPPAISRLIDYNRGREDCNTQNRPTCRHAAGFFSIQGIVYAPNST